MDGKTPTKFEDLPDELLLLICQHLNAIEILDAFTGLNSRLSKTISDFCKTIDLNLIPPKLINRFVNEIFPFIGSKVQLIIFHDDFVRFPIRFEEFNNLESIHFVSLFSEKFPAQIRDIKVDLVPAEIQADLIERLFSSNQYSNLSHLEITSFHGFTLSKIPLNDSIQIEDLTINLKNNVDLFAVLHLLSTSIKRLSIHIVYNGPFVSYNSSSPLKLAQLRYFHLKTTFEDSIKFKQLEVLLTESLPLVEHLSIETLTRDENYINGHQWKNLLQRLTYLKNFMFSVRYRFKISEDDLQQSKVNDLLYSFSTDFWLEQRKWFVSCYSTASIQNYNYSLGFLKRNYEKLYLHTCPYPYSSMDATSDISRIKSTDSQCTVRRIYSNVRRLYYDGEDIPVKLEYLISVLYKFKSINELKLDRLTIDPPSSSHSFDKITFQHLKKLTIYNNSEKIGFNLNILDLASMYNLRYLRVPQNWLIDYSNIPRQLEMLVLTECRDIYFDFVSQLDKLRTLRLHLNNFDRLLENDGELLLTVISSTYKNNRTMESLHLMCPGVNQKKLLIFEKKFNATNIDYLHANYDGKSLKIHRSNEYFN